MRQIKERKKILHVPKTQEIFYCLSGMPSYCKILANEITDKPFIDFLRWLNTKNFYNERTEKISIKQIAVDYKSEPTKVTKWIKEIYEEIFELNYNRPELFQQEGIKIELYIKYYDNSCFFNTTLQVIPREFEFIRFPFVKGQVGADQFWVKKIEYTIEDDRQTATLWLDGKTLNKYREFALDKALFQGWIHFMDVYEKDSSELDKELKRIYPN